MNISLHVWRVPRHRLPALSWRLVRDRGRLRRTPGVSFAKLLGTSADRQFGPARADPTRWAALVVSDGGDVPTLRGWDALAEATCRLDLHTVASHGRWSGQDPFAATATDHTSHDGMVLALTRARLRPSRALRFWRAAGPVGRAAAGAPGLLAAFGIGEAPLGWQGTVSLWRSAGDLVEFAYRHPDHRRAIDRTPAEQWYAEELFARFAVVGVNGDRQVVGWKHEEHVRRPA